ncbi:MAG: 2-(1,2-epoxy-1,2-dihydrophenyl)acetyl-CoA isomerase PaaG [Pseudomonadota bacterium]
MSDTVLEQDHGTWVELTLNRPDRLNSFTDEMHRALSAKLDAALKDGKRAILLTGAGRGFCAGQDLGDRDPAKMNGKPDLGRTLTEFYNPLIRSLRDAPMPVISAVNGVAAGAGANLAFASDIVLAADTAKFIQSFAHVGLVPDAGGSWHLTRLLGPVRAKALAMTGEPLPASDAAAWGLIWKALPAEDLMDEARALAERLGNGPTVGLTHTKRAIAAAATNTLEAQLVLEAEFQKTCGDTADYAEGVSAFLQKRPAEFFGR